MVSSHLSGFFRSVQYIEVFNACHCNFLAYFYGSFLYLLQFLMLLLKWEYEAFKERQKSSVLAAPWFIYPKSLYTQFYIPKECNQPPASWQKGIPLDASVIPQIFRGSKKQVDCFTESKRCLFLCLRLPQGNSVDICCRISTGIKYPMQPEDLQDVKLFYKMTVELHVL